MSGKKLLILKNTKSLHKFFYRVIRELENFQIDNVSFTYQHSLVENWSSNQVENWFLENELHPNFVRNYGKLDGFTLKQLYLIHHENPQFFYKSVLSEISDIEISDLSLFISKLKNLFGF